MNPLRRLFSENGISASPARTRTRVARRGAVSSLGERSRHVVCSQHSRSTRLLRQVAVNLKTGKDVPAISPWIGHRGSQCRPNSDTILLPNGTIKLTIVGPNEDNAATGDLDIKGNVTIKGKGASSTIIDGNSLGIGFSRSFPGRVLISGLTIQHGQADEGAGLLNSGGQVTLTSVVVANNEAAREQRRGW